MSETLQVCTLVVKVSEHAQVSEISGFLSMLETGVSNKPPVWHDNSGS